MTNLWDANALAQEADAFIAAQKTALLCDIKTLVDIPSTDAPAKDGAPFGPGVAKALDAVLTLATDAGLDAHNVDGYFGYADLRGKSKTQLAVITHIDVVPQGNGWTHDAFDMIEKDGYLLGRGVADDKGPAILTLYAAKFFAQRGVPLPYTLRLMFGTNEEKGMGGLTYYQQRFENPAFCFTPDADFPVCYGEKGIYGGNFISAPLCGNLIAFEGGMASNAVPDLAFAVVKADFAALRGAASAAVTVQDAGDGCVRITCHGKGGHASLPDGTVNAIALVVDFLLAQQLCTADETVFLRLLQTVLSSTDGSSAGIAAQDDIFTPLTCIGGTIAFADGVLTQNINIRYPTGITAQQITEKLEALAATAGARFVAERETVPFVTSADTPMVQALIETYNEVTGKHEKPFTIGGGTYARHFPSAVSFGPEEPGEPVPAWVGSMHGADEGISVALLLRSLKIYILSLARLMQLDF
ncbi:MAG: Sapep family Mn(2+)-dependent dipeptidase [Ruthenibacterium sp.]